MEVIWRGNEHTNKSSRQGKVPIAIVDHVVAGSGSSCDSWFRSPGNNVGSAHYTVWEDGKITQYVDIRQMAWANGIKPEGYSRATAKIVKQQNCNPNLYTISIEHAGHTGKLTPKQFESTVWLHKHIQSEVKRIFGTSLLLDRDHVLGHYEIDPVRKPNCPGPDFPWTKLMAALAPAKPKPKPVVNAEKGIGKGVVTGDAWLHSTPDFKSSSRVRVLAKGETYYVYGIDGDLYDLGGGFFSKKYFKFTPHPKKEVVVKPQPASKKLYRVQVGAFSQNVYAEKLEKELERKGYEAIITKEGNLLKVQTGAFSKKENAEQLAAKLKREGYQTIIN